MISASHFSACIWYFIARLQDYSPETWVSRLELLDKDFFDKYTTAYYWAF